MNKPICFNAVKAMERIAELEAENAHLRGEIKGAKILIWQQKNLVRCRDCKHKVVTEDGEYNPEDIVCDYWMSDGLDSADFCSYGERIEEFDALPSAKYITEKPNDAVNASNDVINRSDAIDAVAEEWLSEASAESPYVNDYDIGEYRKLAEDLFADIPSADAEQGYTEWLEKIIVYNGSNEWLCEDTPDMDWCEKNCHYSSIQAECLRHLYEVSKGGDDE